MKTDANRLATGGPARTPTYEEISQRAYELWEQDGRPEGNEQQHWYQAEKELSQGRPASAATSVTGPVGAGGAPAAPGSVGAGPRDWAPATNGAVAPASAPGPAQTGARQPAKGSSRRG